MGASRKYMSEADFPSKLNDYTPPLTTYYFATLSHVRPLLFN